MIPDLCSFDLSHRIHVWTVSLANWKETAIRLGDVLDEREKERAQRLTWGHLRESFIAVRGALRCILGFYLNTDPFEVRLCSGPKGKPQVVSKCGIQFNLSRSKDFAAVAIAAKCRVGIDIEHVCELAELEQLAHRFFCPRETAEIFARPSAQRKDAFFRCWTRKEAYVKALGAGLSVPLDSFDVTGPESTVRFVRSGHGTGASAVWRLRDLDLAPGYSAALAYSGDERGVSQFPIIDLAEFPFPCTRDSMGGRCGDAFAPIQP